MAELYVATEDEQRGLVRIGDEVIDVAAAFTPYEGKDWAVVASTNDPSEWPAFFDAASRLRWDFRHSVDRGALTYLFFARRRR
ncbi:MAG TPA: hypothetical protein VH062_02350 [Polyangiaceae bacterium]|jgi:hypothetical protein|nr:hypothetical protein [Polyangiaceae bacterium]